MRQNPFVVLAACVLALSCSRATASGSAAPSAIATLRDATGRNVGSVEIRPANRGLALRIRVSGLAPGSHGVHIHTIGTCDGSTTTVFSSAGAHFNPTSKQHGRLNPNGPHAGDLPNVVVDASGNGTLDATAESLTLDSGLAAILDTDGSAVIIHANQDDERTDTGPSGPGNSGARVACGVLQRM
jgi:superoxide dismutase, Cu-Zn family